MICYHNFQIHLNQYAKLGKENHFPEIDCCPMCRAQNRLKRHGFYERNAIEQGASLRIPICRLRCPDCKKTLSIFPVSLLPYFQHTIAFILLLLLSFWLFGQPLGSRQLRHFYTKRFQAKQTEIALLLREAGDLEPRRADPVSESVRLLEKIRSLGEAGFVSRWWRHRFSSFMAATDYHGTRVVAMI